MSNKPKDKERLIADLPEIPKGTYEGHLRIHGNKVHIFRNSRKSYDWWKCELCHELDEEELKALTKSHAQ